MGANAGLRNFLKLKFSEMQSSAFWTLKFSKCLDSILNMYSNSYRLLTCNAEIFNKPQVWLKHFMVLAGAEAIAARAQPSGKGGNIAETLSNPVCLRQIFTACILGALVICDLK